MVASGTEDVHRLLDLALADPQQAVVEATARIDVGADEPSMIIALRARGLAHRLLVQTADSFADLDEALTRAESLGDQQIWAGVATTMAGTLVYQGKTAEAKQLLLRCVEAAIGLQRVEARFQLGTTYAQAGELDEALAIYDEVLPQIRDHGRDDWEAQLIGNRGVMRIHTGDYEGADNDLATVIARQIEQGSMAQAAINMHNRAQALYMCGDLAASLDMYRRAEELQDELGLPVLMHAQKTEAFLAAGMFEQTLELAQRAHTFHRDTGVPMGEILSLMPGAEAAMALDQFDLAATLATAAINVAGAQAFPAWVARARLTLLDAKVQRGLATSDDINDAMALYDSTRGSDSVTAARALLIAATIALSADQLQLAEGLLTQAGSAVRKCPLHVQIERWTLVADCRQRLGSRQGTLRAVRAGLRSFDALLAGLTAFDVRARVVRYAERLTDVGVAELLDADRVGDALTLLEQLRSGSLQLTQSDQQSLRDAERSLRRGDPDASGARLLELQKSQTAHRAGSKNPLVEVDGRTYLTYVDRGAELLCIVSTGAGHRLVRCGPIAAVAELIEQQSSAYRQLARREQLSAAANRSLLKQALAADSALQQALLPDDLTRQVVIGPSTATQATTWAALPELFECSHTITVARAFANGRFPTTAGSSIALGASELGHVPAELARIASASGSSVFIDPAEDPIALVDGTDIAHIAGHFNRDGLNPLFSKISLGPQSLRGVDLLRLKNPPNLLVLSSCGSGAMSDSGGAPFGFASAALAAGSSSVIVTQATIEDSANLVDLMGRLHDSLSDGMGPADALQVVRSKASEDARPLAATLTVLGAGWA